MKIVLAFILSVIYIFAQQTFTDNAGTTHTNLPDRIERIADAWPAHNAIVTMLGHGDQIVATIVTPQMCPWLYKINPHMSQASLAFSTNTVAMSSAEELLKAKPDVVFTFVGNKNIGVFRSLGIPVVELSLVDFPSLRACVLSTGSLLGQSAHEKAQQYANYLDHVTQTISAKLQDVPEQKKPKVLHLSSITSSYIADGSGSMMDSWIRLAGGINVAKELTGPNQQVSAEQIVAWNPDIVIIGAYTKSIQASDFLNNPMFKNLSAVQSKRVFINPKGMFFWDRYSAEAILQVQWAAQIFYPDRFKDFDIEKETIAFYTQFFNYPLSQEEAKMIINGIPPK